MFLNIGRGRREEEEEICLATTCRVVYAGICPQMGNEKFFKSRFQDLPQNY